MSQSTSHVGTFIDLTAVPVDELPDNQQRLATRLLEAHQRLNDAALILEDREDADLFEDDELFEATKLIEDLQTDWDEDRITYRGPDGVVTLSRPFEQVLLSTGDHCDDELAMVADEPLVRLFDDFLEN